MHEQMTARILKCTQAEAIVDEELIQPLWNDYGTLSRVKLRGGLHESVIVKHIQFPSNAKHPRGFSGTLSHERKVRSYEVETHWYRNQNRRMPPAAPTPDCLDAFAEGAELFLLLEDLGTRGFDEVSVFPSWEEVNVVLSWLAHFHARFIDDAAEGLWPCGSYWHLATRPEELANIAGSRLHCFAGLLDARLRCGAFPTLVHGDAKLANFLFTQDKAQVAAVDFQYVGRGAAMKDVAYFVGSCLDGPECERLENELLDVYFDALRPCLPNQVDAPALEAEWRSLYPVAWADCERFMLGWNPVHRKLTDYSDATTERAIDAVTEELIAVARAASLAAGRFIQENRDRPLKVTSKGFESKASDVVTEIDLKAQAIVLDILEPTFKRYDLGLLAEEGEQDDSRLHKHAFWAIDPLDGTQCYIDGKAGYATSIALVAQSGEPILGVVYDPINDALYESVKGRGVTCNGEPIPSAKIAENQAPALTWYADRSLREHPHFETIAEHFAVRFAGGAVMNCIQLLANPYGAYIKQPKKTRGGCAIWDLAAVSLMLKECGGNASHYGGTPLNLNRPESIYFGDVGLIFSGAKLPLEKLAGALGRAITEPRAAIK